MLKFRWFDGFLSGKEIIILYFSYILLPDQAH